MNVSTEANPQDILSQHYNQANLHFQAGEFKQALEALDQAKQYAADDHQREHIETTIATVKQSMGQVASAPTQTESGDEEGEPTATKSRPNSMLILTVLVGLVCITPIAMKFIEIFSQPRVESAPNTVAEVTTESTTESNSETPAGDAGTEVATNPDGAPAPEATAAVIVNAEQPESAVQNTQTPSNVAVTVNGNNVNMRSEASVSAARVTTLAQGVEVQAIAGQSINADGFQWQQIKTSTGQTGWVASRFLQANATAPAVEASTRSEVAPEEAVATTAATPATAESVMKVTASGVSVRTTPSTSGSRLIALSNTTVTVLEPKAMEADGYTWSKIRTQNGTEGWVAHQFLSP